MTTSSLVRDRQLRFPSTAVLVVLVGVASVRIGYPSFDFRNAVLVLVTGLAVAGCGLVLDRRVQGNSVGLLLVVTGLAWYAGGFRWVAFPPLADLASGLSLVYAAVAAHALLAFPTGRHRGRIVAVAIVAGYLASVLPVPRADLLVATVLGAGLLTTLIADRQGWRLRAPATVAGAIFAVVLGGYRLLPAALGVASRVDTRPLLQASLVSVAVVLTWALLRRQERPSRAADLVVELATSAKSDLARTLGDLLGDPDLELGFAIDGTDDYVDARGRTLTMPSGTSERSETRVVRDGATVAVLVHAVGISIDADVHREIARAVSLTATNGRLQAEHHQQIEEVRASRRRLLNAEDESRSELERRLRGDLEPRFIHLEEALAGPTLAGDPVALTASSHLRGMRAELDELVRGIHPLSDDGQDLRGALADIASRAPLPVELDLAVTEVSSRATRTTILFVASEALANVAKHAAARRASLRLAQNAHSITVEVADDGRGGADPDGSGLLGLRDRVETLGGRFSLDSRPGMGTRMSAVLPSKDRA